MKLFRILAGAAAAVLFAGSVAAAPIPYVTAPFDTINASVNAAIASINAALPSTAYPVTCTGTTTATCQGLNIEVSYTGLTTAAGVTSATSTVTDASVAAASTIFCMVNSYAGTGNPTVVNIVPGVGSFTYAIQNTHASAALNTTVVTNCFVYN